MGQLDDAIADGTHPAGPWLLEACEAEAANIDEAEAIVAFARRLLGASPDAGGTVAWQNERGHAALHVLSCRAGSANPSVGLLLASLAGVVIGHGADVSATDVNGYAPLHLLALAASQVRPRTEPASAFRSQLIEALVCAGGGPCFALARSAPELAGGLGRHRGVAHAAAARTRALLSRQNCPPHRGL